MGQVYRLTNKITKKSYIGKTNKNINSRYGKNWNKSLSNKWLRIDVEKLGQQNFELVVLHEGSSSECENLEAYYIEKLNTVIPNGYNTSHSGGTKLRSELIKKEISSTMKNNGTYNKGVFTKGKISDCELCHKKIYSYKERGKFRRYCSKSCWRKYTSGIYWGFSEEKKESLVFFYPKSNFLNPFTRIKKDRLVNSINNNSPYKGYKWERII